jgi:outer membrane protein assembly factor BamB
VREGPGPRRPWPGFALLIAPIIAGAAMIGAPARSTAAARTTTWTVYHGDAAGSGVASGVASVDTAARAWTSARLDGALYGEPLIAFGAVFVATENGTVYALSSRTGAVLWSRHIATPVPASALPCGNIAPTVGITGTPVIDPSRHEIFVVADELKDGRPAHVLVGLDTATGAVERTQSVDPPGADPAALLQRTGLALDGGRVVFGMGGNYGDCATYRGRVAAVGERAGMPSFYTVDAAPGTSQGAVWMGGAAPVIDASGNIWVSAGNGSVTSASQPYDDSDSALELTPSLQLAGYFAPTSWPSDNAHDRDMSVAPALVGGGQVVLAGKAGIAYLLKRARPGGIGGQQARLAAVCAAGIEGGSAVVGDTVVLPCLAGPVAVRVTAAPARLGVVWRARVGGGPPVVVAGLVWTIGRDGVLDGLDAASGALRQHAAIGAVANHFPTPSVGDGVLVAAGTNRVIAFRTTAARTAPNTPAAPAHSATSPAASSRTASSGLAWGAAAGGVILLAAIGARIWWRRR